LSSLDREIVDRMLLVNKHYNTAVKAGMNHLFKLFWIIEEVEEEGYSKGKFKHIFKDGELEGEQVGWYKNGQLNYKEFYKEGKQEGEQLEWYEDG